MPAPRAISKREARHPPRREHLDEFVGCYQPVEPREKRQATWSEANPTGRWRTYTLDELLARDKVSPDLFWLRDESMDDGSDLPEPHVLAAEFADDLRAALEQIEDMMADRRQRSGKGPKHGSAA